MLMPLCPASGDTGTNTSCSPYVSALFSAQRSWSLHLHCHVPLVTPLTLDDGSLQDKFSPHAPNPVNSNITVGWGHSVAHVTTPPIRHKDLKKRAPAGNPDDFPAPLSGHVLKHSTGLVSVGKLLWVHVKRDTLQLFNQRPDLWNIRGSRTQVLYQWQDNKKEKLWANINTTQLKQNLVSPHVHAPCCLQKNNEKHMLNLFTHEWKQHVSRCKCTMLSPTQYINKTTWNTTPASL